MNSVIHPAGPEPETTYWIRRAVVIAAALVALSLIWWVLSSLFSGGDEESVTAVPQNPSSLASPGVTPAASTPAASTPAASASGTPSSSASPSASASESASATPTPSTTPTPTGPQPCESGQLSVDVSGPTSPKAGQSSTFTVKLGNTGDSSCTVDLAKTPLLLEVTSGPDRIWSSAHCSKWQPGSVEKTIPAGKSWDWAPVWPGKRSRAECIIRPEALLPGTYRATVSIQGGPSDTLVMNLTK